MPRDARQPLTSPEPAARQSDETLSIGASTGRALRVTLLVFFVVASLHFAQPVLKPLALAVLFALILTPAAKWLEGCGFGRVSAAAVTLLVAVGAFMGAGTAFSYQLAVLANDLQNYQAALHDKLAAVGGRDNLVSQAAASLSQALETIGNFVSAAPPHADVKIVADPLERVHAALAPYVAFAGAAGVVLILVFFLLVKRDDMSDRIVGLFGQAKIGLTTRALDEAGRRISRYLSAFAVVNLLYGITIGLGLWAIGLPVAALWGAIAGVLRFIPYIGAAAGFLGPMLLAVIIFPGWQEPLLVLALFGTVEAALAGAAEPLIYGKSTGISPIALLVSAMFWTWLWGPLGLLLSTPLTVSLAVAGKYVPGLSGVATLLSERSALLEHLRLYQRLLAGDAEEARTLLDSALQRHGEEGIHDAVLLPTVLKSQRDFRAGGIGAAERDVVWRAIDDFLDELEWKRNVSVSTWSPARADAVPSGRLGRVIGVAPQAGDVLVLRMLNLLLAPWRCQLVLIGPPTSMEEAIEVVVRAQPGAVVASCVDDADTASMRVLRQTVRERSARSSVLLGAWGVTGTEGDASSEGLPDLQVGTLTTARDAALLSVQTNKEVAKHLAEALFESDDPTAKSLFARCIKHQRMDQVCREIVEPVVSAAAEMRRAGRMSAETEERVCAWFRERLHEPVTAVRTADASAPRALLACPDEPEENLQLMLLALSLRARGWDVVYLGNTVPAAEVADVAAHARAQVAVFAGAPSTVALLAADFETPDGQASRSRMRVFFAWPEGKQGHGTGIDLPFQLLPDGLSEALLVIERTADGSDDAQPAVEVTVGSRAHRAAHAQ